MRSPRRVISSVSGFVLFIPHWGPAPPTRIPFIASGSNALTQSGKHSQRAVPGGLGTWEKRGIKTICVHRFKCSLNYSFHRNPLTTLVEVWLIFNTVLVSGAQHCGWGLLQIMFHYRLLQHNGYNSLCWTVNVHHLFSNWELPLLASGNSLESAPYWYFP